VVASIDDLAASLTGNEQHFHIAGHGSALMPDGDGESIPLLAGSLGKQADNAKTHALERGLCDVEPVVIGIITETLSLLPIHNRGNQLTIL